MPSKPSTFFICALYAKFYYLNPTLCTYVLNVYDLIVLSETITRSSKHLLVFMTFIWNNVSNTDWDVTEKSPASCARKSLMEIEL